MNFLFSANSMSWPDAVGLVAALLAIVAIFWIVAWYNK